MAEVAAALKIPDWMARNTVNQARRWSSDAIADAMHLALTMSLDERRARHAALNAKVHRTNAEQFCRRFIDALMSPLPTLQAA